MKGSADILRSHVARASASVYWQLEITDVLITRSGLRREFGLGRNREVIINGDVLLQFTIFDPANVNAVALLLNGRIGLYALDLFLCAQAGPRIARVNGSVDCHAAAAADMNRDISRTCYHIQVHGPGDLQCLIKRASF